MMMVKVADAISKARSLTSIHLCSNPGTTQRVKDFMTLRVRAMHHRNIVNFAFGEIINALTGQRTRDLLQRQLTSGREMEGEKPVARETIKVKQNMERKRIFSLVNEFTDETDEE